MNKRGNAIVGIIAFIIAIVFIIFIVDLQTTRTFLPTIIDSIKSPSIDSLKNLNPLSLLGDFQKKANGITFDKTKQTTKNILGFNIGIGRLLVDFLIGLIAGFWIWLIFTVRQYWRFITRRDDIYKSHEIITERKNRWINLIAGRWWKIIFMGIIFAVFMQVPIINRILQIITLEIKPIEAAFFTRTFILAIILGFLPAWFEDFRKKMIINKLEKKARDAAVGSAATQAAGSSGKIN